MVTHSPEHVCTDEEKAICHFFAIDGPVDRLRWPINYSTIGDNLKFYQNEEMLALNTDKFVGLHYHPVL